jgi:hypothetical protein
VRQETLGRGRNPVVMTEHESSRTLVKSTPELWAECSDAAALARHLGSVGEIRITRLEPETTVAWEGAAARGTVELEPAGWGTRVTLTMTQAPVSPAATPADPALPAEHRPGWWGRLRGRLRGSAEPVPQPHQPTAEAPAEASPAVPAGGETMLQAALDSLGRAHHRPYSRA